MDAQEIKKEAKQIMDNFMEALSEIEVEEDFVLERDECFRDERKIGKKPDEDFIQRFLRNAPQTCGTAIQANKGDWTKNG